MRLSHPFDPIIDADSKILILGSFPSIASFEQHFYYAHPRNAFWPIMEQLFDVTLSDVNQKKSFLHVKHIALWDTYGSLRREAGTSSDANLAEVMPNPIDTLLVKYPKIQNVFCNGTKAHKGLLSHFKNLHVSVEKLPSTSPAYAAMTFNNKLLQWQKVKESLETH
jgi:double-stranded uracil-DNA glycosylase